MFKNNKKGFTIVELVIVIAVIAILASVLIPTFSGVVAKANASGALQKATSAMKSTLAMSTTGTLTDETYFAVGTSSGVTYNFIYKGNKIQEADITAHNVPTKIIVDKATAGTALSAVQEAIIKDFLDLTGTPTFAVTAVAAGDADQDAAFTLKITVGETTTAYGLYINSDYPADLVTFTK